MDGIEVTIQKTYTFGSQTIAMRVNGELNWVLGDHLGSTSVTANADGSFKSQIQYTAFGELRASIGITDTEYRYTNQLRQAELGLYYYVARWYDPVTAHFTSADTIVPGSVQGLDRYAYVNNSPVMYTDPSGHRPLLPLDIYKINVSLHVNLPSSLQQSGPGAQYYYNRDLGIPREHYNLCGDISLSMIYETVTGKRDTLGYIYGGSNATGRNERGGTNAYQVGQQFAGTYPAGWSAVSRYNNYVATFDSGNKNHTSYAANTKSLTQYSMTEVISTITFMLMNGHYVIAGVSQDPATGDGASGLLSPDGVGHWVVVTEVSYGYISINNPFTSLAQKYSYDEFYASFQHWLVEIIPPNPRIPSGGSGNRPSLVLR